MPDGYMTYRVDCGHVHVHVAQRKTDECGIACVAMVLAKNKSLFVDLSTLRSESQGCGGGYYRPSAKDAGAPTQDPRYSALANVLKKGTPPPRTVGTYLDNMRALLAKYGLTSVQTSGVDTVPGDMLAAIASKKLLIARIGWTGGGGHFVVVHGKFKGKYCILDPWADPGLVQSCVAGSSIYNAPYGSSGNFTHCVVVS